MTSKILILLFSMLTFGGGQVSSDLVPNQETAIKIAEAVWLPIYGERIYEKKPFEAVCLGDSVWQVRGTLPPVSIEPTENGDTLITFTAGGVPVIFISKKDASIKEVYHTK